MRHRATAHARVRHPRAPWGAPLVALASVGVMVASALALVAVLSGVSYRAPADAVAARGDHRVTSPPPEGTPGATPAAADPTHRAAPDAEQWTRVLARLDRQRGRAYAAADPALLRAVYVPGSAALRRDQRLLARYAGRGLHVHRLRMHVADLRVSARRSGLVVLRVRDRVASGTVIGHGRRRPLPADSLDTRLLTLRRVGRGAWLMAGVRRPRSDETALS